MRSISKAKIKLFTSLHTKKYRYRHQKFLIEGKKLLQEAINSSWDIEAILIREDLMEWGESNYAIYDPYITDAETYKLLSQQQQAEGILAVINFPFEEFCLPNDAIAIPPEPGFILDAIQDPGNLGTLMRSLDWLGIKQLILGPGCVDPLNLKTLRSSMGAIFRMELTVIPNLEKVLKEYENRIYLADMSGERLGNISFPSDALILIGNEAHGVSQMARNKISKSVFIPRLGTGESLNAGVAASIIAWEIVRANQNAEPK